CFAPGGPEPQSQSRGQLPQRRCRIAETRALQLARVRRDFSRGDGVTPRAGHRRGVKVRVLLRVSSTQSNDVAEDRPSLANPSDSPQIFTSARCCWRAMAIISKPTSNTVVTPKTIAPR